MSPFFQQRELTYSNHFRCALRPHRDFHLWQGINYFPSTQMSIQGFGTCSGKKYELSGNEIRQVKPNCAGAFASLLSEQIIPYTKLHSDK